VTTADLERWLAGQNNGIDATDGATMENDSTLVYWQTTLAPLVVILAPQHVWLIACSLVFLIFGLGLSLTGLSRARLWIAIFILSVGLGLAAIWWPSAVPVVVYGCEPGVVVLLGILALQWLLNQRYRRQVVFLPGFSRMKAGSSVARVENHRPRGEPSTVDAPMKRESSVKKINS
jgi:hypothetical protein